MQEFYKTINNNKSNNLFYPKIKSPGTTISFEIQNDVSNGSESQKIKNKKDKIKKI
jgi:hypothetical protein